MPEPDEYPKDAVLCCMPVADSVNIFADNIFCRCAACGLEIHHRPHVPDHVMKVCIYCVHARMTADEKAGKPLRVSVTRRTLEEAKLFFSKVTGAKQ